MDVLDVAGAVLEGRPVGRVVLPPTVGADGSLSDAVATAGMDRVDVYVDGRPRGSSDVTEGTTTLTFAGVGTATALQVQGFAAGELVAARTQAL
jgi:hypothetical protein